MRVPLIYLTDWPYLGYNHYSHRPGAAVSLKKLACQTAWIDMTETAKEQRLLPSPFISEKVFILVVR